MPKTAPTETLAERIGRIRERFIDSLPERLAAIEAAASSPEGWGDLVRLAHGLVGSGGTFGFPALTEAARVVESAAKAGEVADAAAIDKALARLRAAVRDAADPEQATPPVSAQPPAPAHNRRGDRGGSVVHLLEDDADLARELALQLGAFGYEVRSFSDVAAMVAAIDSTVPDALVVDIMLTGGEYGPAAVARIGERLGRRLPTLFLSARADFDARLDAVRAGCDGYLVKPVDAGLLAERLDLLTSREAPEPFRILLVDDDRILGQSYEAVLQDHGLQVRLVTEPEQAVEAIETYGPDLIVTDLNMPRCNGFELAAVIRQHDPWLALPILFLTSEGDLDNRRIALEVGGDAFLTKPIALPDLVAHVSARAKRARQLRGLMIRDSLTGLLNHAMLLERLDQEVGRARREGAGLCFAFIDIDHFKAVNDTHGHPVGDRVIKALSRLLLQQLRRTDIIGRFGGEEFAVIMPGTRLADAAARIDGLRTQFAGITHPGRGSAFAVSFSAGIATLEGGMTPASLTVRADERLYAAKRGGRNRVVSTDTDGTA